MNILLAGDSRCACPPRPNSWPHMLEQMLSANFDDINIVKFFAVEDTYIFTMFLLADKLQDYPDDYFDFAVIHSGWHDYMESWPRRILDSLVPEGIDESCIIDDTSNWVDSYRNRVKEHEYMYRNEKRLIEINELLKKKCKNHIYIGIHTLIDGSDLHKKNLVEHQKDIIKSNKFFANLSDFLNLPQHYSWTVQNTTHDRIHYTAQANFELSQKLLRYIKYRNINICDALNYNANVSKNNITVNDQGLSYKYFVEKAKAIGSYICHNTDENDVVLIDGETSLESIAAFIGCIFYKRIPMFIQRPSSKVSEKEYNKKMLHIKNLVNPSVCVSNYPDRYPLFKTIPFQESSILEEPNISSNDLAFVQLSSGTTGLPKLMKVFHKDLISHYLDYQTLLQNDDSDTIVSWLPLYHDMGLIGTFLIPLLANSSIVLIDPFTWLLNPSLLIEKIKEHKATYTYVPNFALNYLYERCEKEDLSFMKYFISCSEPTSMNYIEKFQNKFSVPVRVCYALAENIFAVSFSNNNLNVIDNTVSCGKIIDNVSVLIMKDGNDVTEKDIGNIFIKSNYSENSGEYGYYNTGDIGFINNGELYVIGRDKDNFVSFGKNIYPDRIEELINSLDEVKSGRCACFGIHDPEIGTCRLHICLELKDETNIEVQLKIRSLIEQVIGVSPIMHIGNDLLIKTSSGKVSRSGTRENITNRTKNN